MLPPGHRYVVTATYRVNTSVHNCHRMLLVVVHIMNVHNIVSLSWQLWHIFDILLLFFIFLCRCGVERGACCSQSVGRGFYCMAS